LAGSLAAAYPIWKKKSCETFLERPEFKLENDLDGKNIKTNWSQSYRNKPDVPSTACTTYFKGRAPADVENRTKASKRKENTEIGFHRL
jgi:hypothetical protein